MIYLDNSATSFPKPEAVYRGMDSFYRKYGANPGRSGHKMSIMASRKVEQTREKMAGLIHAESPDRIAFAYNATDALNMAIRGILKPGDEVITTVMEHNSVLRPLAHLEAAGIIKMVRIRPDRNYIHFSDIRDCLTDRTKLVVIGHASNVTGWTQPIEEIGPELKKISRALFLVDASQTAGVLPIDVQAMRIDLLAFTGHKALYGPTGTGGLYVRMGLDVEYWRTGGSGVDSEEGLQPPKMPYRLEAGTDNVMGLSGLYEGLEFIEKTGMEQIRRGEAELHRQLVSGLRRIPGVKLYTSEPGQGLGVVSLTMDGLTPVTVASILDQEFDIAVRAGLQCAPSMHRFLGTFPAGTVRLSLGALNTPTEITDTLRAIQEISGSI